MVRVNTIPATKMPTAMVAKIKVFFVDRFIISSLR
jgi:hypothetical protein